MSIGLIVGTGLDFLTPEEKWQEISTPYGPAHLAYTHIAGKRVILMRRHGPRFDIPAHLVNYRANLFALREWGATRIIATAAVGSLRKKIPPGSLAIIKDFIDFTTRRDTTQNCQIRHLDLTVPYCTEISNSMRKALSDSTNSVQSVTYVCVDGPRYETPAEVRMFAKLGADVVGMTGVPEVVLAHEFGICYGSLAIITNFAAGITNKRLSHTEVIYMVKQCRPTIEQVLLKTVETLPDVCNSCIF